MRIGQQKQSLGRSRDSPSRGWLPANHVNELLTSNFRVMRVSSLASTAPFQWPHAHQVLVESHEPDFVCTLMCCSSDDIAQAGPGSVG